MPQEIEKQGECSAAVERYPVSRWREGAVHRVSDSLVVEEPLEIRLDGRRYTATMRTPGHDDLLAKGLLFTEGVIESVDDIERLELRTRCRDLNEDLVNVVDVTLHDASRVPPHLWERSLISNSSCGLCGKATVEALTAGVRPLQPSAAPSAALLLELPDQMRRYQTLFEETGGVHAAALFDGSGLMLACFEDIGRHNATDKAIGYGLERGFIPAREPLVLLVSGRASFEIVQKALMARIPTVAAVSAASSLAVQLAAANGLNLAGFLRAHGCTLYCGNLM